MSGLGLFRLDGAIDLHVHSGPSLAGRPLDDVETAQIAAAAGLRGILLKDHFECTASRAYHARRAVPGIEVFGGVTLNSHVGGLNPAAAEASLLRGGKQVWMPTVDSQEHADVFGATGTYGISGPPLKGSRRLHRRQGITIAEDGDLKPEVKDVVAVVKDYDGILGTSHLSDEEVVQLVRYALDYGVARVLVTHVDWSILRRLDLSQVKELARQGAYVEFCATCVFPPTYCFTPEKTVAWVREIGPERCVLASDAGAPIYPGQVESLRSYGQMLSNAGLTPKELRLMMADNPAGLLDLP